MYMSRVSLRRAGSAHRALAAQLGRSAARDGGHALLAMLFSEETSRSFVWREDPDDGRFRVILVSKRAPADELGIFDIVTKAYDPQIRVGETLSFVLRANPVVRRRDESGRLHKHDVAMHALRDVARDAWPTERWKASEDAVRKWLESQGERHGFEPIQEHFQLVGSDRREIRRERGRDVVQFTSFDMSGMLVVRDVDTVRAALSSGLGAARAYGCGLLLVRRA
jgi:CRISPR system Cascade subunit CasE